MLTYYTTTIFDSVGWSSCEPIQDWFAGKLYSFCCYGVSLIYWQAKFLRISEKDLLALEWLIGIFDINNKKFLRKRMMAGKKCSKRKEHNALSDYKFDTSSYVILSSSVRRDADSGGLVKVKKSTAKAS